MFSLKQDDEDDTFRVKRTIGSSYNADEDDVRKTKSALKATGDYKPPKWGMTGVTDDGMFDGLRKFQKREGLQVDGIMRPGGPTEKKLRERTGVVKSAGIAAEKSQAQPKTDIFGNPLPHTKAQTQTTKTPDKRPSLDNLDIDLGLLKRTGQDRDRSQETQVAVLPLVNMLVQAANRFGPAIARSLPPALGLADKAAKDAAKRGQGGSFENPPATPPIPEEWQERDAPAQRQQADPPPPTPGFEPSDVEMPDRTEYPSEPVELPKLEGRPFGESIPNDPLIFQAIDDAFRRELSAPIESHPGDEDTIWWNGRIANRLWPKVLSELSPDIVEEFKHIGGATNEEGDRVPEDYLPNIDAPNRREARRGSSNPDITFFHRPTETKLYFNTGLMLKDGKTGIAKERRSLDALVKNAGGDIAKLLAKYRPGMDVEALDESVKQVLRDTVTEFLDRLRNDND